MLALVLYSETLTLAEAAFKRKDYQSAVRYYNVEAADRGLSAVSYFFRGSSHNMLGNATAAVDDLMSAFEKAPAGGNLQQKVQISLFKVCYYNCGLNCARMHDYGYFLEEQRKNLQELYYKRQTLLRLDDIDLADLEELSRSCSSDAGVGLALFIYYINYQDLKAASSLADALKSRHWLAQTEIEYFSRILDLVTMFQAHYYDKLAQESRKLSYLYPDEAIYAGFYKLAKVFGDLSVNSAKLTTRNLTKLNSIADSAGKVQNLLFKLTYRTTDRLNYLSERIFNTSQMIFTTQLFEFIDSELQRTLDTISSLSGNAAYFTDTLHESSSDPLFLKYLVALKYWQNVGTVVRKANYLYPYDDDYGTFAEAADRYINAVYGLFRDCYTADAATFHAISEIIPDINALADQAHVIHMKSLFPDPFKVLNISRNSSDEQVRRAYFMLAKRLHPDTISYNASEEVRYRTARRFYSVAAAYDVLTDPVKKYEFAAGRYDIEKRNSLDNFHNYRKQNALRMLAGATQWSQGYQYYYYQ